MPRFPSPRMSLFCALSAADFLLTWWLLHRSNGRVYEANPVAAGLLVELGWAGLAAFKVVVVLLAVGSIAAVARRRPRMARGVMGFGCAVLLSVVGYSGWLAAVIESPSHGASVARLAAIDQLSERLDTERGRRGTYNQIVEAVYSSVRSGRSSVSEAARTWLTTPRPWEVDWLLRLRKTLPTDQLEQQLAAKLIIDLYFSDTLTVYTEKDLLRQFQSGYGESVSEYLGRPGVEASLWGVTQPVCTDLWSAAARGDHLGIRLCLAAGAGIDQRLSVANIPGSGATPLHIAVAAGQEQAAKILAERGADLNAKAADANGGTPLHWAAALGRVDFVTGLLLAGADANATDSGGYTPMDAAILFEPESRKDTKREAVSILRKHGGRRIDELRPPTTGTTSRK